MKKLYLISFSFLLFGLISGQEVKVEKAEVDKAEMIDELMNMYHENRGFWGTVLVADNGKIIYNRAFGLANIEWNIENTTDTRFALASLSKPLTATLAVIAAQKGELSLDDTISKYLPEYPLEKGNKITIRHLLLHTSGIPIGILPQYDRQDLYQERQAGRPTREQYLRTISGQNLLFEPGSKFQYSNFGYSLLAMVLEGASGKTYPDLLRERIFKPLGMTNTYTDYGTEIIKQRASRYFIWFMRDPEIAPVLSNFSCIGASDVMSTTHDLFLFDRALYSNDLIKDRYRKEMFTPIMQNNGFGWNIKYIDVGSSNQKVKVAYRQGGSEGIGSIMFRFIEDNKLIIILSNLREPYFLKTWLADLQQEIAPDITAILYDEAFQLPKKSAVKEIGISVMKNEWVLAEPRFIDDFYSKDRLFEYSAEEFNYAGFSLYNSGNPVSAICLFSFAENYLPLDDYDRSWEIFFNHGRSLMALKRWADAIPKFEKAIKINPDDPLYAKMYINYCEQQLFK